MSDLRGLRIAAYARFSTDKQSTASADDQIAKLERWVEPRGGRIHPALRFRDEATSGAILARRGLDALIDAVGRGDVDVLLVEDLGRLSRDSADSGAIRRRLAFYGVRLIAIDDGLDTAIEGSDFVGDVHSAAKAQLRREVAKKTLRGHEGRVRAGFASGGVPFGYRTVRVPYAGGEASKIEIDDAAAAIVREIFTAYGNGDSLAVIAARLNGRGVPAPRSSRRTGAKAWQRSTIRVVLRNTKYVGRWTYGETQWQRHPDTRRRVPRERSEALVALDRPDLVIVDGATWDRVRERLASIQLTYASDGRRRVPRGTGVARAQHALSGILVCGACSVTMTIAGGEAGRRYYACPSARRGACSMRRSVREPRVRTWVVSEVRERLGAPAGLAMLEQIIAEEIAAGDDTAQRRRELAAKLDRDERRLRAAIERQLDGDASDALTRIRRDLETSTRDDRASLEALTRPAAPSTPPTAAEVLDGLSAALEGEPAAAREALRAYLDGGHLRVEVEGDAVWIRGAIRPDGRGAISSIAGAGFEPTTFGL